MKTETKLIKGKRYWTHELKKHSLEFIKEDKHGTLFFKNSIPDDDYYESNIRDGEKVYLFRSKENWHEV